MTRDLPKIHWAAREGTTLVLCSGAALTAGGLWLVASQLRAHDYDLLRWVFVLAVGLVALVLGARDQWNTYRVSRHGVESQALVLDRWTRGERHFISLEITLAEGASSRFQAEVSEQTYGSSSPGSAWRVRLLPSDPRVMKLLRAV